MLLQLCILACVYGPRCTSSPHTELHSKHSVAENKTQEVPSTNKPKKYKPSNKKHSVACWAKGLHLPTQQLVLLPNNQPNGNAPKGVWRGRGEYGEVQLLCTQQNKHGAHHPHCRDQAPSAPANHLPPSALPVGIRRPAPVLPKSGDKRPANHPASSGPTAVSSGARIPPHLSSQSPLPLLQ